jgi:REP element-mobilizing transposase RayT
MIGETVSIQNFRTKKDNKMKYISDKHNRRSMRLRGYDYTKAGIYFVTLCSQNREQFFGYIKNEKMTLNDVGEMINKWWKKIPKKFSHTQIGPYVIMPNHIHGILIIQKKNTNNNLRKGEYMDSPLLKTIDKNFIDPKSRRNNVGVEPCFNPRTILGLPRYISWFKRMTTNEHIKKVRNENWQPFDKRLWQRNYYDHIIKDVKDLNQISWYIKNNPLNWNSDKENPDNWDKK